MMMVTLQDVAGFSQQYGPRPTATGHGIHPMIMLLGLSKTLQLTLPRPNGSDTFRSTQLKPTLGQVTLQGFRGL